MRKLFFNNKCNLCSERKTKMGGITTNKGYWCYACIQIIFNIANQCRGIAPNPNWKEDIDNTP